MALMAVVASSRAASAGNPQPSNLSRTRRSQLFSASAQTCWSSESVPSVSRAAAVTGQPSTQPDSLSPAASWRVQETIASAGSDSLLRASSSRAANSSALYRIAATATASLPPGKKW